MCSDLTYDWEGVVSMSESPSSAVCHCCSSTWRQTTIANFLLFLHLYAPVLFTSHSILASPVSLHSNGHTSVKDRNKMSLQSVVLGGPGGADQWRDRAAARRQTAAERRGASRRETKAGPVTPDCALIRSRLPARGELISELLGLKSGFIFPLTSRPVCSGEPRSCRPPLWVL